MAGEIDLVENWKIVRDRTKCEKPGCTLAADLEYFAILELPDCVRRDLCAACFRDVERTTETLPPFWKARRKVGKSDEPAFDLQSLRALFDRLGEDDAQGENASGLRYLIALLLLRKRVLRMVDPKTPEQEAADLVVVDPKADGMEPVALRGPEMTDERLAELKGELLTVLGSD